MFIYRALLRFDAISERHKQVFEKAIEPEINSKSPIVTVYLLFECLAKQSEFAKTQKVTDDKFLMHVLDLLILRIEELNIVNLSIILFHLIKIRYENVEHWKLVIKKYFELIEDPSQMAFEMLDQNLITMALNSISKTFKARFRDFESEFLFAMSGKGMQLFENFGEGRFDKQGLTMTMLSLGRFQEIYKKTNPA